MSIDPTLDRKTAMAAYRGWANIVWNFEGIRVLVTGGSSGIGKGVADAYCAAGAEVTVTGTRPSASDYDEDLSGRHFLRYNAEDPESTDAVAAAMPDLDILVNSAGVALFTIGLDEQDPDVFDRSLRLHLSSVFRLSQRCRPALAGSRLPGGGSILGVGSMSSLFAYPMAASYGTAKTGLIGMVRQLAVAFAPERIRVNALAVGLTRTRHTAGFFADASLYEPMQAATPLGRPGEPQDIAGAALFLSSDAASWITGQVLPVDGGYSITG